MITNILKARQTHGFSQEKVANAIGVSRPTYINIENGKKELTLRQAETLSTILHIGLEEIKGGAGGGVAPCNAIEMADKYKQMILNVIRYGADTDGKVTKTKLAKMVYLVDFIWHYEHSSPMSNVSYRKLPRGPVADLYFRVLDEMEEDGLVVRRESGRAILFSLVEEVAPDGLLTGEEIDCIRRVCGAWREKSTQDIVNFTHGQAPWQICFEGEVIPYDLIFQEEPERVYGPVQI